MFGRIPVPGSQPTATRKIPGSDGRTQSLSGRAPEPDPKDKKSFGKDPEPWRKSAKSSQKCSEPWPKGKEFWRKSSGALAEGQESLPEGSGVLAEGEKVSRLSYCWLSVLTRDQSSAAASRAHTAAVWSSAGNAHSMRSSSRVTSCGIEKVVMVSKN